MTGKFDQEKDILELKSSNFYLDIVIASEDGDEVLFTKLKEKDNDFGVRI